MSDKCSYTRRVCKRVPFPGQTLCENHLPNRKQCEYVSPASFRCNFAAVEDVYCEEHFDYVTSKLKRYKEFLELRSQEKHADDALQFRHFTLENDRYFFHQRSVDSTTPQSDINKRLNHLAVASKKALYNAALDIKDYVLKKVKRQHFNGLDRQQAIAKRFKKMYDDAKKPMQIASLDSAAIAVATASSAEIMKSVKPNPSRKINAVDELVNYYRRDFQPVKMFTSQDAPNTQCCFHYFVRTTISVVDDDYNKLETIETAVDTVVNFLVSCVEANAVPEKAYDKKRCQKKRLKGHNYCYDHIYRSNSVALKKCLMCSKTAKLVNAFCQDCFFNKKLKPMRKFYQNDDQIEDLYESSRVAVGECDEEMQKIFEVTNDLKDLRLYYAHCQKDDDDDDDDDIQIVFCRIPWQTELKARRRMLLDKGYRATALKCPAPTFPSPPQIKPFSFYSVFCRIDMMEALDCLWPRRSHPDFRNSVPCDYFESMEEFLNPDEIVLEMINFDVQEEILFNLPYNVEFAMIAEDNDDMPEQTLPDHIYGDEDGFDGNKYVFVNEMYGDDVICLGEVVHLNEGYLNGNITVEEAPIYEMNNIHEHEVVCYEESTGDYSVS